MVPWNVAASSPRSDAATAETGSTATPSLASATSRSAVRLLWRSTSSRMRAPTRSSTSEGSRSPAVRGRLGESRTASSSSATRTMQNSSRLDEKMAVKRSRSSSGMRSSPASSSTRASHSSHESSRSKSRDCSALFLGRRTAITRPRRSARARGRRNQRSSPRSPAIGSIAAAPALGNETRAPVTACSSTERSGSWPTSTSSSPWRSVSPARSSTSTPSSAGVVGQRRAELLRDDLGGLVGARVRARHDALRLDLESRQRAPVARAARRPAATSVRSGSGVPSARSSASACRTRMIATGPA